MLNRSEILRSAWASYREQRAFAGTSDAPFSRKLFGRWLALAWKNAKAAAVRASLVVAAVPARVAEIKTELFGMEMGERIDWNAHRNLRAELAGLGA